MLLSLAASFPRSCSLQPSLPATQDPLPEPGCSWSLSLLCPDPLHPTPGEVAASPDSSLCSPGSLTGGLLMTEAFPTLGISCFLLPLLIPFGFVGRGEESGGQASSLGATGKRWIMCLFFNSMKKAYLRNPLFVLPGPGHSAPVLD